MRQRTVAMITASGLFTLAAGCERVTTPPRHAQMATRTDALPPEYAPGNSNPPTSTANDVGPNSLATTTPLTDAQIAGVTEAANSSEVELSKIAERKARDPDVQHFAAMMISHHEEAQREQAQLGIESAASTVSERLQARAQSTMDLLRTAMAGDFDRVYIETQVEEHKNVLDLIDSQLLPNVKDVNLKVYIENIRSRVEAHLHKAETEREALSALALDAHFTGSAWRSSG